ncbi:MAG: glycosyltransferase family 2 protein [Candidatus Dormibacteria bacterium]
MTQPRVSVVVPAYNEGPAIAECLDRILSQLTIACEVLVVYDLPTDSTAEPAAEYAARDTRVRPLLNEIGPGPAGAIKSGILAARAPVVVVTMADGSDDPAQIEALASLVEEGAKVAVASRYMHGGRQLGGPPLKGLISRTAGLSLHALAGVSTHDPTNSFKAYSRSFLTEVGIESDAGFEIGIEMVAKAHRRGLPVVEIPTTWHDRTQGQSNFKVTQWIPRYLHWYLVALLPGYGRRRPNKR